MHHQTQSSSSSSTSSLSSASTRMSSQSRGGYALLIDGLADSLIVPGRILYLKKGPDILARITDLTTGRQPTQPIDGHPLLVISRPVSDPSLIHFVVTTSFKGQHVSEVQHGRDMPEYYIPHQKNDDTRPLHPLYEDGDDDYRSVRLESGHIFDGPCYFSVRGVYSAKFTDVAEEYEGGRDKTLRHDTVSAEGMQRIIKIAERLHPRYTHIADQHLPSAQLRSRASAKSLPADSKIHDSGTVTKHKHARNNSEPCSTKSWQSDNENSDTALDALEEAARDCDSYQRPKSCPSNHPAYIRTSWRPDPAERSYLESPTASGHISPSQLTSTDRASRHQAIYHTPWRRGH